jgi:tetratricopeptide (TPR) repeat protein
MKLFSIINSKICFIAIAAVGILSTGCAKRLDILPYQSISSDKALLSESDVNAALIGCYDAVQSGSVYGGDIMVLNELTGNTTNIQFTGTFQALSDAYNGQMIANNSFAASTWIASYGAINRCNNVLTALDKVTSGATAKNKVQGEALFLRASLYFELVRLYAKFYGDGDYAVNAGVPLITKPTLSITDGDYVKRNTVKEVYDLVTADLVKAESLLPTSNSRYATKWAAAAQLSRVYLMLGKYTEARDAANRVINGSGKSLNNSFPALWFTFINNGGSTPSEYLFYIKLTTQDGVNSLNTYFGRTISSIPGSSGRSDCKIKDAHVALYEANDVRKNFFIVSGGSRYTQKHLDKYGDVPVIRLAEMFLTRAESNFRLNTSVGAAPVDDINLIRVRAGLPTLTVVTLPIITKERSLELAFEGHGLIEAKRLKTNVGTLAWNSPKLIFPIPQREMDANKNLVQNEGY